MKKLYIAPQVEVTTVLVERHLCAESTRRILEPDSRWGSNLPESLHGNASWVNEGYTNASVEWDGIGAAIPVGEDDGSMNSRSNTSLWED